MVDRSITSDILSIYMPSFFIFVGMGIINPMIVLFAEFFEVSFAMTSLAISMYAVGRIVVARASASRSPCTPSGDSLSTSPSG
jgi:putative effector of murein hydrolase LrgA (UPF0299 family)